MRPAAGRRFRHGRGGGQLARAALQGDDIVDSFGGGHRLGAALRDQPIDLGLERIEPATAHCNGGDDRHPQFARQNFRIERQPVPLGQIDHVERDDDRQAQRDELQGEAEVIVEIGGIDDHDQCVGPALARLRSHHDVARDLLVEAAGIEAISAGEVDQLDRAAIVEHQPTRMPLDGDAGIIAHLLPRAGQRVEQGTFAGIGIADERNQRCGVHQMAMGMGEGRVSSTRRDADRGSDPAAQRHGHPADPAGDRATAQRRPMQHLDPHTFVKAQFAQATRLGQSQLGPVDRGHGRRLPAGKGFETAQHRHAAYITPVRLIINYPLMKWV